MSLLSLHNIALIAAVGALVMGILSLMIPFWSHCRDAVFFLRSSASRQYKNLQIPMPDDEFFKRVYWSIAHAALQDTWFRRGFSGVSQQSLLSGDRATVGKFFRRSTRRIVRAIESDVMVNSMMHDKTGVWQHYKMPLLLVFASLMMIALSLTSQILVAGP